MLKKIRLIDFKSFVDEGVELAPLTLLVGANASGKSNFLDAIRFLQGTALDLTLGEVLNGEKRLGPDSWPGIRGRAGEAARLEWSRFTIESVWLDMMRHRITCRTRASPSLVAEHLEYGNTWVEARDEGAEVLVEQAKGGSIRVDHGRSLSSLRRSGRLRSLPGAAQTLFEVWEATLGDIRFVQIKPLEMRDYGRRGQPLGAQGQNISGVLADLSTEDRISFLGWLREFCAPEIEDLDFLDVKELGDVMAMFVERNGKHISARSISDGTLHFLGTLLALRTAEPGSILLIEEIETGLHPTRIRLLVEYLEAVTRERQIQVIATTHSPVVLQWLSDESLRNTIVFGRVPDREGTIMRRIGDLPHFDEVIQRKGIDELFTTGWLEMAL